MTALLTRHPTAIAITLLAVAALFAGALLSDLPALWQKTVVYAIQMQRELHRELATAIRAVEQSGPAAHWTLVSLGFFYGLFHAIGPGHGKVVISTYLATHESRLGAGLVLSFISSLLQGITAVAVVGGSAFLLERSLRDSQATGIALEAVSYGFVATIGLFLMVRSGRRLFARRGSAADAACGHCGCHHNHGPDAADLAANLSIREMAVMILSVGIRPCSGAIIVLILAFASGLIGAGIAAVAAMSLGTGIAVAALATVSVYARQSAIALAGFLSMSDRMLGTLLHAAAFLGGALILVFGVVLLQASLVVSQHPLL